MTQRISYITLGAVVFFCAIFIFVFAFWLHLKHESSDLNPYLIFFHSSVSGLSKGSPVRYKGINVGTVDGISISEKDVEKIRVEVSIDQKTPVRKGTVATLGFGGLTGDSFIELKGTPQNAPPLLPQEGHTYPVIPAVESSLDRIFKTTPELLSHADSLIEKAALFFSEENRLSIQHILQNIRGITEVVAAKKESIGHALDGTAHLANTLDALEGASQKLKQFLEKLTLSFDKLDPHVQLFAESGLPDLARVFAKLLETLQNFDEFMHILEDKIDDLIPPNETRTYQLK